MKNSEIAKIFSEIVDLLELKGENQYKIRAYKKAAQVIESYPAPIEQLYKEGKLQQIPGVGESIAAKIVEILRTGKLRYYEKLKAEFPPGITSLLEIPGVGPKTALSLWKELGITSIEDLERLIEEKKTAILFRLGEKTAANIIKHVRSQRRKEQRILLGKALPIAERIVEALREVPGVHDLIPVGSLRRFKETVGDIDIMATADEPEKVLDVFVHLPGIQEVLAHGGTKASVIVEEGVQIDLRVVEKDSFGSLIQYFTGSKEHNIALRERGLKQGLKLSEYGITDLKTGNLEKFPTEEGFYERLGLQWIPPELREARGEIERAALRNIPKLIELKDIKGDLHVHTKWSDGQNTIEAMALAAKERGYEYIAITDHSAGRGIARGLGVERLKKQIEEIKRLNQRLSGIKILAGIEVDIRADGTLDLPDEILQELDVVVAAIHSAMSQDKEKMTKRIIAALEHPLVNILAHPTCRIIGEREEVDVDLEEIMRVAARTGTALEINSMPDRLDLRDIYVSRARELGVKLSIDTDAHAVHHLDYIRFGVGVARRGWCEPKDIINTWPLEALEDFLRKKRALLR